MKIRTGFVSNSSSASFVVASNDDLTEEMLLMHFQSEGHPMAWLMRGLAKYITEKAEPLTVPPKAEDTYGDHVSDRVRGLSERFKNIYTFCASNEDGDTFGTMLYNEQDHVRINTDGLVIHGEHD